MDARTDPHPVRDFFINDLIDYAPKDDQELMQRPFFSIAKQKRNKPIEYTSADGTIWVKVEANPTYGMATIWDADILIWCISRLMMSVKKGTNDIDGVIHTTPYQLLKGIARETGGEDYKKLMAALTRLQTTRVETNIRKGRRKFASFHYIDSVEGQGDLGSEEQLKSLSIRVPEWLLHGIREGAVLTLDREYFLLKGGIERAVYRAARKHAGSQRTGWTCRLSVLHEKTGSEAPLKGFTFRMRKLMDKDQLPRYAMTPTETENGEPAVHFIDRKFLTEDEKLKRAEVSKRFARDQARTGWIDSGAHPDGFEMAFDRWC